MTIRAERSILGIQLPTQEIETATVFRDRYKGLKLKKRHIQYREKLHIATVETPDTVDTIDIRRIQYFLGPKRIPCSFKLLQKEQINEGKNHGITIRRRLFGLVPYRTTTLKWTPDIRPEIKK